MQDDPMLFNLRDRLNNMFDGNTKYSGYLEKLNNRNILDTIGLYKGKKSYTINKEKIFLCLIDENNSYYDQEFLIYVLLHELAHVICDEIGHTKKFNKIFEELLIEAAKQKVYDPSTPMIPDYCQYND
jgi:Zn-dependent peptidase ImmA (M78 family)